jgi:hypothetical protein
LSRLRFTFVLSTLIGLAVALAACGSSSGGSSEDPHKVVDNATLAGIESGNVDLSLSLKAKGKEGGNLDVSLRGPFQSEGKNQLPQLDLKAKATGKFNGEDVNFEGGLTLLPNSAYVEYGGTEYEVDPTTFGYVKSAIEQAQQKAGGKGKEGAEGTSACQEAAEKLQFSDFMENLANEGGADVGGTSTTKVSGDLSVSKAIGSFFKLAEGSACGAQLGSLAEQLPSLSELSKARGEIEKALKTAHVELYVGDDHIVRRVAAQIAIEPPKGSGEGPESAEVKLDLSLSGVNERQTIEAPSGAKPLNQLFQKLGINPIELLGGEGGEGGAGGLGSLLEGLSGATGGGSSEAGGEEGSSGATGQQAYLKCLQSAETPVDLQNCAKLLK